MKEYAWKVKKKVRGKKKSSRGQGKKRVM